MNKLTSFKNNIFVSVYLYKDIRVLRLLILGFSSGIPILLIFSTLSLWLKSAGLERSTITLFSWAGLAYSFKFLWAPLIDRLPIYFLSKKLGHRKSWLAVSQICLVMLLFSIGFTDPMKSLFLMALIIVLIGFCSATQDALVDTYRIESAPENMQNVLSSIYVIGYRLGMITSGAGSLILASYLGGDKEVYNPLAWQLTYMLMALIQSLGLICCLMSPEPIGKRNLINNFSEQSRLLIVFLFSILSFISIFIFFPDLNSKDPFISALITFSKFSIGFFVSWLTFTFLIKINLLKKEIISSTFYDPFKDFINNYGKLTLIIIIIIGVYRISDIVLGVIANIFYVDQGYTILQIASFSKFWGLIATILGGIAGGLLSSKHKVLNVLFLGGILSSGSNILFAVISIIPKDPLYLFLVIVADNFSGGIASVAFVAFLSSLTNIKFTTTQFALFTSMMVFIPKLIGGYSGSIVDTIGYFWFFIFTTLLGLPVLFLIHRLIKNIKLKI
jgi:PAT family beta-lactamase induction signal transducer AmpG